MIEYRSRFLVCGLKAKRHLRVGGSPRVKEYIGKVIDVAAWSRVETVRSWDSGATRVESL